MTYLGFHQIEKKKDVLEMRCEPYSGSLQRDGVKEVDVWYHPSIAPSKFSAHAPVRGPHPTFQVATYMGAEAEDVRFMGLVSGLLAGWYDGKVYDLKSGITFKTEIIKDSKPTCPADVLNGILGVRDSGLTNMLDRKAVVILAKRLGFSETARWISNHASEYSEGIFRGFDVEKE